MELEAEAKARRLKMQEAREARRLEAEKKKELRLLEAEKEKARRYGKKEAENNRISGLEKTRIGSNSSHGLRRGGGVKEDTVESQMVKSLK